MEQRQAEGAIFGQKEHGAPEQLFEKLGIGLHFVERDYYIMEESHMLITQRHSIPTDNRCQDIEDLRCSIEFMRVMYKTLEHLIHSPPHHLAARHYPRIQLVEDVFQVLALRGQLAVEEVEELLDE